MEAYEEGKDLIVKGIIEDAKAESEKIVQDAKKKAEEKVMFAKKQAESIINDAKKKSEEQIDALQKRYISFIELETKKRRMNLRDNVYNMVIDNVKKRLNNMINGPAYKSILKSWIYEAAMGLFESEGVIRISDEEANIIDDDMIHDVEKKLRDNLKLDVKLILDKKEQIRGQGIILYSTDGKRAFNNEISTRILRRQREIQGIIYDALLDKIE